MTMIPAPDPSLTDHRRGWAGLLCPFARLGAAGCALFVDKACDSRQL